MGAWNDLLNQIKTSVAGPVVFAGTIFPTSDNFPSMAAQLLKGGFFALDNLDQLADIPYQNLQLDQEVVVRQYGAHERTRYRLYQMPTVDTRISDIPGYDILNFWEPVDVGAGGDPVAGNDGWTPVLALENDGPTRVVMRLVAWTGGTGQTPGIPPPWVGDPNAVYIGPSGFVPKSGATNLKGDKGDPGNVLTVRPEYYVTSGIRQLTGMTLMPSGVPYFPWEKWPPPGVLAGHFGAMPGALVVRNDWTQPRKFRVFGQVHVCNANGGNYWAVKMQRNNATVDVNFAWTNYADWNPNPPGSAPSVFKIPTNDVVTLNPGVSATYGMLMAVVNGGMPAYRTYECFFEAWGL